MGCKRENLVYVHKFKVNGLMIKMVRKHKKISRKQLVKMSGVCIKTIGNIECNRIKKPTINVIANLADALDLTLDQVVLKVPQA